MEHKLRKMTGRGDDETPWIDGNGASLALAEAEFNECRAKGYLAFKKNGNESEQITAFDATAPEIVLIPQYVGG